MKGFLPFFFIYGTVVQSAVVPSIALAVKNIYGTSIVTGGSASSTEGLLPMITAEPFVLTRLCILGATAAGDEAVHLALNSQALLRDVKELKHKISVVGAQTRLTQELRVLQGKHQRALALEETGWPANSDGNDTYRWELDGVEVGSHI